MSVGLAVDGRVGALTIAGPAKRNAMSFEMWSALPGLLGSVAADDDVRALVIRGTDHFSAGADISEFTTLRAVPARPPAPRRHPPLRRGRACRRARDRDAAEADDRGGARRVCRWWLRDRP